MKRFYSHYTFIYPDTFLTNHIVETSDGYITGYYPFVRELSETEFYSGLLVFIPEDLEGTISVSTLEEIKSVPKYLLSGDISIRSFRV